MSITKSRLEGGDVRYVVRWREQGRNRSASCRTKKEAEAVERAGQDRERARRRGLPVEREHISYEALCERYLAQHQVRSRTLRTLRERLSYSRDAFGDVPVREMRVDEIGMWCKSLAVSDNHKRNALAAMRQVLRAGVAWEYLVKNPAADVRAPAATRPDILPFESWDEVDRVEAAAGAFGPLVRFATATGLRPQEWIALRWSDVSIGDRSCTVSQTISDGRVVPTAKTDGSLREVMLQRRALEALESLPRPLNSRALVFAAPNGGLLDLNNWRRRVFAKALRRADLAHRSPKDMRHTYACLALAADVPIEWISRQLGHTNIATTLKYYARFLPVVHDRQLARLDAFADSHVRDRYVPDG